MLSIEFDREFTINHMIAIGEPFVAIVFKIMEDEAWDKKIFAEETGLYEKLFKQYSSWTENHFYPQKQSRKHILTICFALGLTFSQTERLAKREGYSFEPDYNRNDFAYKLMFEKYSGKISINECNKFLSKKHIPLLGKEQKDRDDSKENEDRKIAG